MITAKVNSVRGFLQRNLCKCPSHIKSSFYITYVHPILEYACTVWSPYHQHNISKIEMAQRRAARFVTNSYDWNSSVTDMLQHLEWEQLQHRWDKFHAITTMYKMINNLVDIDLSESHLQPTNSITIGHPLRLMQLQTNLHCYKHSFLSHAIIWNSLPTDVVLSSTLDAFEGNLEQITVTALINFVLFCTVILSFECCTVIM